MKFVVLLNIKEGVDQAKIAEAVKRRAEYEPPVKLLAEYYTPCRAPSVIGVCETDDANTLLMHSLAWLDVFDIQVFPVVAWEEGLQTLGA